MECYFARFYGGPHSGERRCETRPAPLFAGLMVSYEYRQWVFPIGEVASTDPKTEPGAVLQFDQRVREWLIGLAHSRSGG